MGSGKKPSTAKTTLRESEERHRIISELTTDYMCIITIGAKGEPKMTWASDGMKKMTGRVVTDTASLGQWIDTVHPDDRPRFMEFVRHTFTSGETGELECRSFSKTGSGRWVRILVKPQRDGHGVVRSIYVGVKDISESRNAQELLRRSAGTWAATFDAITNAIVILDGDHRITQCNAAFIALVGRKREDLGGHKCHEILHCTDHPIEGCPFVKMAVSGKRETMELTIGGRIFVVLTDPIMGDQGVRTGAVHIMADITDRKTLERDKALVEEELRQALKMEAIGHLASGVAHDFNNMLAGIMGNAELLQLELAEEPKSMDIVGKIIASTEHAARLTRQLLAFARKGRQQLIPLDLHVILAEAVGILANTMDRRIRIEQDLRASPSTVLGDPSQLANAFMNLSLNARDAMPDGGLLVFATDTVELDRQRIERDRLKVEPGIYIRAAVTDTGTGMEPEVQRHLFEPFFTTKEPGKGTGLGLAGVYGNIVSHGGAIECMSEPGRGSVFTIYLPVVNQAPGERNEPKTGKDAAETGAILLADDEPVVLDMARFLLTKHGYSVHAFCNGRQALAYFREHHAEIDLVILDMIMPEMDGRRTFKEMKKIAPDVRVLLSSGYSADGEAEELMREGVLGFIQKPYRLAEILGKVQEALER